MREFARDGGRWLRLAMISLVFLACSGQAVWADETPLFRDTNRKNRANVAAPGVMREGAIGSAGPVESARRPLSTARLPSQTVQDNFLPDSVSSDGLIRPGAMGGPDEVFSDRPKRSMRPRFNFGGEWLGEASGVEITSFDAGLRIPTYPVFGPPPPMINVGMTYTDLAAPGGLGLPGELYDYSFGMAWMRPINERWMLRLMLTAGIATDGENRSSDAWQFRGGFFAMYRQSPEWNWMFGVLALGRNDLPVIPAVGAIWSPNSRLRFDLIMPRPRISVMLHEQGDRQHWGYLGAGFSGGTWAYQTVGGLNDQLTYKDWRVVLGWELVAARSPGAAFGGGQKIGVEAGYVFSREFEFERGRPDLEIDDTWMLRAIVSF